MTKSQRLVIPGPREVVLEWQDLPDPGPGQVLLRTERTLISTGTELTALTGDFPPNSRWAAYIQYPVGVGYSSVATVERVGEGVARVRAGDRVASWAPHASHALRAVDSVWPVAEAVPPEAAAFATLAEIVMNGLRRGRVQFGESIVVVGAGLLGQLAVHFCRAAGAWPVIAVDPAEWRLEVAHRMGAHETLALPSGDAVEEVERLTRGRMADAVFEVTGNPQAIPGAFKLARQLGRVVLLGSPRGPVMVDFHEEAHTLGLEIIGAHNRTHPEKASPNAPWDITRHVELFLEWQASGVIDVRPLISHRYPWRQAPEAYQMLLEDRSRALGVILDWSD